MTDTTTANQILPIDRAAMRSADRIVFRTYRGTSTIECIVSPDGSMANERTHAIPVRATISDYGKGAPFGHDISNYSGFSIKSNTTYGDGVIPSIIARIGKGDDIVLMWVRDNNNELQRSVNFVTDELKIRIVKPSGKWETYLVDRSTGLDNSARMVKRER
jgi:hypothetical protein